MIEMSHQTEDKIRLIFYKKVKNLTNYDILNCHTRLGNIGAIMFDKYQ